MKSNVIKLLTLSLLFGLVACGNEASTSSSTGPTTTIQPTMPPISLGYEASDILSMLNTIGENGNYTLEYKYSTETYHEFYTEKYGYFEATGQGYVAIEDYKNPDDSIFYIFNSTNESIELGRALYNYDAENQKHDPVRSSHSLDYMRLIASEDANIKEEDFIAHQTGYYTRNEDVKLIFANLMGYSDSVNLIDMILFKKLADDALEFKFYPNFKEGYEKIDGITGVLKNIGSTSVDFIEEFVNSYKLPANSLSDELVSVFSKDVVSLNAKITRVFKTQPSVVLQNNMIDYSANKMFVSSAYGSIYYGQVEDRVTKMYEKSDSGDAILKYIDVNNEVVSVNTGSKYDNLFEAPSKYFEGLAFRSEGTQKYTYYGYNARWLIKSLTTYDLGVTLSCEVTVTNGKIAHIEAITPTYFLDGIGFYTKAEIDVVTPRSIPTIESYGPNSNAATINNVLSLFNGETSFDAKIISDRDKVHTKSITVADDIFLYSEQGYDTDDGATEEMVTLYDGYKDVGDGLIPFEVEMTFERDAGVAVANDEKLEGMTMSDMIGFTISADVLDYRWGSITVKDNVDKIGQGVLGGRYDENIIPSSFELEVDMDGYPISISYKYEMDNGYYLGEEEIQFSNWGTATLPSHIDFSNIGTWEAPTSWATELRSELYADLVNTFGQEYVDKIPYLFAKELIDSWEIENTSADIGGGTAFLHLYSHDYNTKDGVGINFYKEYAKSYAELLVKNGFVETVVQEWGNFACFKKDDVHIRVTYNAEIVDIFVVKEFIADYTKQ